jgi:Fe-S cluster assembly protein SufD
LRWKQQAVETLVLLTVRHLRSEEGADLLTFTADASAGLSGPDWLTGRRSAAWERFAAANLPSEDDDLWKYSGIDALDLDSFALRSRVPASGSGTADLVARARAAAFLIGEWSALVVTVDGSLVAVERGSAGDLDEVLQVHGSRDAEPREQVVVVRDAFDELHAAFAVDEVHVEVAAKAVLRQPVVVVHMVTSGDSQKGLPACFPHLYVHVDTSAEASVVEVIIGDSGLPDSATGYGTAETDPGMAHRKGLVVPLSELEVSDDARLSFASLQLLPVGWQQLGVQAGRIGRDASLRSFCASLGAATGRVRADALLGGQGGEALLVAGYFGTGDQVHDLRTVQDHVAPRTSSQLLCMGAVTDHARSVYVGLTRVRNGAHGADAFQTNRNLVLSDGAHADSVPNLDIEENEVRCSHASTVGPIDEDQRYYLESRGIDPSVAERLIVLGFFNDLSARVPIASVGKWFVSAVSDRIREHVGRGYSEKSDSGASDV